MQPAVSSLACKKHLFTLPPDQHYLNCAYIGPSSRRVEEAGIIGLRRKSNPASIAPADFFSEADTVRRRFARVINAPDPRHIAIVAAVSYGLAIVARNTPVEARQNIVVAYEQFPSNVYTWMRLAKESGAEMRTVMPPDRAERRGEIWNDRWLQTIDRNTALVALPHVHWADGTRFDLERISARAREVGAAFVVDGTQSVGALPFDVQRIRPDALVVAGYKWLFGPYGMALAYLGPRYQDGVPLEENWINRKDSERFDQLVNYREAYQPGALRYDVGERSNPILLPMLAAALEHILEWRPENIQEYCAHLMEEVIAEAGSLGFITEHAAWRGAHLFGMRAPARVSMHRIRQALEKHRVFISVRGSALRISPNVYNDEEDAAALLRALKTAVRT